MTGRLTADRLRRLREVFDAAIKHNPAERAAFLNEICEGDSTLRSEVEHLLAAHSSPTSTRLECPLEPSLGPGDDTAPASLEGSRLGPYELLRQLGCGGMGTVYLAVRRIGKVRQRVAVKIVRASLTENKEIVRRFEHEREILASLDHPNIARLLDIGSTADGVPYLVMDYVEGAPIDVYCDTRKLSISDRLTLFRSACAAIQYAHSKGVIHRDLKPSNILVTPEGILKLLDFGIAKVLGADGQTQTRTLSGSAPMTIEYASPEQIRDELIGPRSDVYSLGVVLYELLTGCRPYRTGGRLAHLVARAICEETPVTPSVAICEPTEPGENTRQSTQDEVSALRAEKPHRLRRRLSGDLDSIVLKALRKAPEWRYDSPAALSDDIGRHMAGVRVTARKDTLRYRIERIVDQLLYPTGGVFHAQGMLMLTAGLLGMLLLLERQVIDWGWKPAANRTLNIVAVVVWLCWSLREGRQMIKAGRFSALDRQSWIVFAVITIAVGSLTIVSVFRPLVSLQAVAIFWNIGLAIGLLIVGLQASSLITAGGIALMISAIAAAFYPESVYLYLASGMLAGMVVPGLLLAFQRTKSAGMSRGR